jgi:hypothetical protein
MHRMPRTSSKGKSERRTAQRHERLMKVPCSLKRIVSEGPWEAVVTTLSSAAIKLRVEQSCQTGIHLAVELPVASKKRLILFRVHTSQQEQTARPAWVVEGAFVKKLTSDEFATARKIMVPAARGRKTRTRSPGYKTSCRWIRVTEEGPWLATMCDISQRGIGIMSERSFEPGMFLKLELPGVQRKHLRPRLVRVTHSEVQPGGKAWLVGGVFLRDLTGAELQALL